MNHRNRLGHRMSAATILVLLSPALMADSVAHAEVPTPEAETPPQNIAVEPPSVTTERYTMHVLDHANGKKPESYPVDVSKFTATPSQPIDDPAHADVAHGGALGLDASTFGQPSIIIPIQPYPCAPPAYEMTTLVPRRRRGRTPWRKAQRGW